MERRHSLPDGATHGDSGSFAKQADPARAIRAFHAGQRPTAARDVATGQATVNLGDGWKSGVVDTVLTNTEDAKIACICRDEAKQPNRAWQCTEYDLETGKVLRKYPLDFPYPTIYFGRRRLVSPDGKLTGEVY